jgi:hypothetical protein
VDGSLRQLKLEWLTITMKAACRFRPQKSAPFGRKTGVRAKQNDTFFRVFSLFSGFFFLNPLSLRNFR